MNKQLFTAAAVCAVSLALAAVSFGQWKTKEHFPEVSIKNFGQMDSRFYRGGQPEREEFKSLADMGIRTVINLRNDPKDWEKELVESLGMQYVHIPMSDKRYPPEGSAEEFLNIVSNPETGSFFVHCRGGKHRTGAMGAVYRFNNYGWNYDQVYEEMKDFDFYTFLWFYKPMKNFVKDYAEMKGLRDAPPAKIPSEVAVVK
ncbi:MAG: tyrosine-protein phosphatase [Aridibacter famidurans]|nr:tyrosine-protein phosphatase [Aridibacter famidurans]